MLQNAYFLAKIGADTAENERNSAENLPKIGGGRPLEEEGREAARRALLGPRTVSPSGSKNRDKN